MTARRCAGCRHFAAVPRSGFDICRRGERVSLLRAGEPLGDPCSGWSAKTGRGTALVCMTCGSKIVESAPTCFYGAAAFHANFHDCIDALKRRLAAAELQRDALAAAAEKG